MNFDNNETFTIKAMTEPCIVNDTDTDTLDWIHGDSRERNSNPVHERLGKHAIGRDADVCSKKNACLFPQRALHVRPKRVDRHQRAHP